MNSCCRPNALLNKLINNTSFYKPTILNPVKCIVQQSVCICSIYGFQRLNIYKSCSNMSKTNLHIKLVRHFTVYTI